MRRNMERTVLARLGHGRATLPRQGAKGEPAFPPPAAGRCRPAGRQRPVKRRLWTTRTCPSIRPQFRQPRVQFSVSPGVRIRMSLARVAERLIEAQSLRRRPRRRVAELCDRGKGDEVLGEAGRTKRPRRQALGEEGGGAAALPWPPNLEITALEPAIPPETAGERQDRPIQG